LRWTSCQDLPKRQYCQEEGEHLWSLRFPCRTLDTSSTLLKRRTKKSKQRKKFSKRKNGQCRTLSGQNRKSNKLRSLISVQLTSEITSLMPSFNLWDSALILWADTERCSLGRRMLSLRKTGWIGCSSWKPLQVCQGLLQPCTDILGPWERWRETMVGSTRCSKKLKTKECIFWRFWKSRSLLLSSDLELFQLSIHMLPYSQYSISSTLESAIESLDILKKKLSRHTLMQSKQPPSKAMKYHTGKQKKLLKSQSTTGSFPLKLLCLMLFTRSAKTKNITEMSTTDSPMTTPNQRKILSHLVIERKEWSAAIIQAKLNVNLSLVIYILQTIFFCFVEVFW